MGIIASANAEELPAIWEFIDGVQPGADSNVPCSDLVHSFGKAEQQKSESIGPNGDGLVSA